MLTLQPPKSHTAYKLVDQLLEEQAVKLERYEGDMHVSLSRPFALRQVQIAPFSEALRSVCAEKRYVDLFVCELLIDSGLPSS